MIKKTQKTIKYLLLVAMDIFSTIRINSETDHKVVFWLVFGLINLSMNQNLKREFRCFTLFPLKLTIRKP